MPAEDALTCEYLTIVIPSARLLARGIPIVGTN